MGGFRGKRARGLGWFELNDKKIFERNILTRDLIR